MLRNNLTFLIHVLYISVICVPVYQISKYISKDKGLGWYTSRYTGGTQAAKPVHSLLGAAS
jgi:hypothetical protein